MQATLDRPATTPAPPAKPRLRGAIHAIWAPVSAIAGTIAAVAAETTGGRIGALIFLAASVLLFGTSGIYHRGTWRPHAAAVLRRMDHANIYVFIAATYTPLSITLLSGVSRAALLTVIWSAALAGLLFRVFWLSAPRWLYTVLYIAMGWTAIGWLPRFWSTGGPAVVILMLVGGLFYTLGAIVYARKSPDPSPRWFGFHEIFHSCTVVAFCCHWSAILLAVTT